MMASRGLLFGTVDVSELIVVIVGSESWFFSASSHNQYCILVPTILQVKHMPYTAEEKKSAITRLRRIQGQALALEKAVELGTPCSALLQQLSALRGATNGLMAEVLESHLRETFMQTATVAGAPSAAVEDGLEQTMRLVRAYLT